ncbi:unnamed protein product [Durusdinium trenchii]|uniref:Uncharacterized protein n=1 Tax=Durusdinium trenchii TaxID=1381693 RepID=A0ABP0QC30_9DINO
MMDDSIVTRVSWTTVKEQHADLLFYAAESVQPPPLMESLKPLAPQPAVGSQAPCEAGARPYGMVNGVNGVNGKSRSPERVDALERHRSRQEVEDRRLGRSEVNGRSRCIFFTLAATFGSPEHSVQETLRPSASSESDPVRLGRSEVNGRSRSPEHSVQESLRPSASSESDPVRLEECQRSDQVIVPSGGGIFDFDALDEKEESLARGAS